MTDGILLIGVDGGATKIIAHRIYIDPITRRFSLGTESAKRNYSDNPNFQNHFKPVNIQIQLAEKNQLPVRPTEDEIHQAKTYTDACADVILEIAQQNPDTPVLVGIGMPGLKTQDSRGISVLANGPRIPLYAEAVEEYLFSAGVNLKVPIDHLGSDADYCGIGEEYGVHGLFNNIENAYYIGGGTGVADAVKIKGTLLPFDQVRNWMAKSWEMMNKEGKSMERFASAMGIQSIYREHSGLPQEDLTTNPIYPDKILEMAENGDPAAVRTYDDVTHNLSRLIFERISTLYCGWQNIFTFVNPNRSPMISDHEFRGTLLDRIIIGQRLGTLIELSKSTSILWQPLMNELADLIQSEGYLDESARSHYLKAGQFNQDLIRISELRAAPALGAGIDAYLTFTRQDR